MNPLLALHAQGQSPWLDYIRRDLLTSGELARLIREDGIRGLTSNPAIFEKAIAGTALYDAAIAALPGSGPEALFEALAIADLRAAADAFLPLYRDSAGADGFVSLEVAPRLAHDTAGTVQAAKRLWQAVDRPNLMIKIPGTAAGVAALPEVLAQGISVNVTLLFAREAYASVHEAWMIGAERYLAAGGDPARLASVASFFVSRLDTMADPTLPEPLRGRLAIANARLAYADFRAALATPRWQALAAAGMRPQRLLWASTGTKNPAYPETLYVDALIGPDTVNTLPPATLEAFRRGGTVARTVDRDRDEAAQTLEATAAAGFDLAAATGRLCAEGIAQFETAYAQLLAALATKRQRLEAA